MSAVTKGQIKGQINRWHCHIGKHPDHHFGRDENKHRKYEENCKGFDNKLEIN